MEPFIVIGPVLIGGGVMTVFFSVEVKKKSDTGNFFEFLKESCLLKFVVLGLLSTLHGQQASAGP